MILKGLELRKKREFHNLTQEELGNMLGKSKRTVITWEQSEELSQSQINQINAIFSKSEIITPENILVNEPSEIFKTKAGTVYTENSDGSYILTVPLVPFEAYASYVEAFQDEVSVLEEWEKVSFRVEKIHRGKYLGFKTKGDSMNGGGLNDTPTDALILGRELQRHHWKDGFHDNLYGFVIITKYGMMHKDIIGLDLENGTITCHSRNQSPEYRDFELELNEVYQIFKIHKRTF